MKLHSMWGHIYRCCEEVVAYYGSLKIIFVKYKGRMHVLKVYNRLQYLFCNGKIYSILTNSYSTNIRKYILIYPEIYHHQQKF